MYRRNFLRVVEAGTLGLAAGSAPSAAWAGLTLAPIGSDSFSQQRSIRSCKIIGIGGAGCNLIAAFLSGVERLPARITAEFLCIDLDLLCLSRVNSYGEAARRKVPLKTISLGTYGAGSLVNAARVATLRHLELLKSAVAGSDAVMLVAGLGGGTGSGVTPMMARLARNAGATTAAAVNMPFDFEGLRRSRNANTAVKYLQRETDDVKQFSCQELADSMGDDITQDEFFAAQDQRIAACIHAFLEKESNLA
jgi:cell division protein FtsZ